MVLAVAVVSLLWPASFLWIDTWAINPMLGVIMFGMGLTLSPHDFKIVLSRPKDILIGCLAQFTVMPLLAFGLTPSVSSLLAAVLVEQPLTSSPIWPRATWLSP